MTDKTPVKQVRTKIADLSINHNRLSWKICARVIRKTEKKSTDTNKVVYFKVILEDDSAKIEALVFSEKIVQRLYAELEIKKVYYISRGKLTQVSHNYQGVGHKYQMYLDHATTVVQCTNCTDHPGNSPYTPIRELSSSPSTLIDTIGKLTKIDPLEKIGGQKPLRNIQLTDSSDDNKIYVALWGKHATEFKKIPLERIISVKNVILRTYKGNQVLYSTLNTVIDYKPNNIEGIRLRNQNGSQGGEIGSTEKSAETTFRARDSKMAEVRRKIFMKDTKENLPRESSIYSEDMSKSESAPNVNTNMSLTSASGNISAIENVIGSDNNDEAVTQDTTNRINTAIPKHSQYATKISRIASFDSWAETASITPDVLSDAGFYYTGYGKDVRCFFCGVGLRTLTQDDNVWIEHARWAKNCLFVKQKKGEDFVSLAQLEDEHPKINASEKYSGANTSGKIAVSSNRCSGYPLRKSYDNTLSQSLVISFGAKMKSVGALVYKKELGTVFRVGSRHVMTAYHVVQQIIGENLEVSALQERSVFVNFNESLVEQGGLIYHLTNFILWDIELDFAVLEISNPDHLLPPGLQLCSDDIQLEEVSFIGYGHPNKVGKHLDPRCNLLPPYSDKISRARKWLDENSSTFKSIFKRTAKHPSIVDLVDTAYQGLHHTDKLIFDCYMQQGGSGSPALTNGDADSIKVVGILTHELPEFYYHLNDTKQGMIKDEYRFEMGSKMSSILKCIYEKDPNLASNLRSKLNVEIANNTRAHEAIRMPKEPLNSYALSSNMNYEHIVQAERHFGNNTKAVPHDSRARERSARRSSSHNPYTKC